MTTEEICNYQDKNGTPIQSKSAENAVLFLWATNPQLEEALKVVNAWGFRYKTNMTWVKDKIGTGYYFRGKHELLLVAVKGDIPPIERNRPPSVLEAPAGGSSNSAAPIDGYVVINGYGWHTINYTIEIPEISLIKKGGGSLG